MITITIEKLTILIPDQEPAPETKLKDYPHPAAEKIAPGANKVASHAKKTANKVKKIKTVIPKIEKPISKTEKGPFLRARTEDEEKQVKAIQNKKWRLKKDHKLSPKEEEELNKTLAEIEENRRKPYTFS